MSLARHVSAGRAGLLAACHRMTGVERGSLMAILAMEALMKTLPLALAALMLLATAAHPAAALEPINKERHINHVLLQGFIGDAIADNCPTIEPRRLRALSELNRLRVYALDKGYTAAEVRAFVTSDVEKARGKAEAAAWLEAKGAEPGRTEAYCRIGEEEIARKSLIGQLLRSTK